MHIDFSTQVNGIIQDHTHIENITAALKSLIFFRHDPSSSIAYLEHVEPACQERV